MKIFFSFFSLFATFSLYAEEAVHSESSKINLMEVFQGSPIIYVILLLLSIFSCVIFLYTLLTLKIKKMMPDVFLKQVRSQLAEKRYEAALTNCNQASHLCGNIVASGILARKHGHQVMLETMHAEGKRCGATLWQRIALLNDVAAIAPMLGLLGTVVGMFYAFYDVNRSADTLSSIFDGLGIAVGTTVAGLIVAILAMVFYTSLKFRVIRLLNTIENEAISLGNMIGTE